MVRRSTGVESGQGRSAGFTLTEVSVTLVIVSVALLSVIPGLVVLSRQNATHGQMKEAAVIASDALGMIHRGTPERGRAGWGFVLQGDDGFGRLVDLGEMGKLYLVTSRDAREWMEVSGEKYLAGKPGSSWDFFVKVEVEPDGNGEGMAGVRVTVEAPVAAAERYRKQQQFSTLFRGT